MRVEWFEATGEAPAAAELGRPSRRTPRRQPQIATPGGRHDVAGRATPITFSGSATDAEDGDAAGRPRCSWEVVLQHCPAACHAHPLRPVDRAGRRLVRRARPRVPGPPRAAADRHRLRRPDRPPSPGGWTRGRSPMTLASRPAGLQLALGSTDGGDTVHRHRHRRLGGSALSAPSPQTLAGGSYASSGWSDGGAPVAQRHGGDDGDDVHRRATPRPSCPAGRYRAAVLPEPDAVRRPGGHRRLRGRPADPRLGHRGTGRAGRRGRRLLGALDGHVRASPAAAGPSPRRSNDGMRVWLDGVLHHRPVERQRAPRAATRTVTAGDARRPRRVLGGHRRARPAACAGEAGARSACGRPRSG